MTDQANRADNTPSDRLPPEAQRLKDAAATKPSAPDPSAGHSADLPETIRRRLRAVTLPANTQAALKTAIARLQAKLPLGTPQLSKPTTFSSSSLKKLTQLRQTSRSRLTNFASRLPYARAVTKSLHVPDNAGRRMLDSARRASVGVGSRVDQLIKALPGNAAQPTTRPTRQKKTSTTVAVPHAMPGIFAIGTLATAFIAGGIIHLATTFAIPLVGQGSAFAQLKPVLPSNKMIVLPQLMSGRQVLPFLAPDTIYAMCRYDVSATPVVVRARLLELGWSLTLYTAEGDNFYAMPGQAQGATDVSFLLVPPTDRLLSMMPGARRDDLKLNQVTAPKREGLIVVRAPLKAQALTDETRRELNVAACTPSELGASLR